jgi:hypothetical protein
MEAKKCCETCIHSRWRLTLTGRIRKDAAGKCDVPFTWEDYLTAWNSVMPECVSIGYYSLGGIWEGRGENCPLYQLNDGEKFHSDGTRFAKE